MIPNLAVFITHFNSRPHKEVDISPPLTIILMLYFNSRPHKEVDVEYMYLPVTRLIFQLTTSQGGRLLVTYSVIFQIHISTHDLTRRSTASSLEDNRIVPIFQLTTSQGGRPCHPIYTRNSFFISTHDLTRRSTYSTVNTL